jgi:deoxyribonuclease (pyrimidine dimer)
MTRINADLHPSVLLDAHLFAEHRELPRMFTLLRQNLSTKTKNEILRSIPSSFTLNTGHMKFFLDKMLFLQKRHASLTEELKQRGYNLSNQDEISIDEFPVEFKQDWTMKPLDKQIIIRRIMEKYDMKPTWYKYMGESIDRNTYLTIIGA